MGRNGNPDEYDGRTIDIVRELDRLKRRGSAVLVTGGDVSTSHTEICRRFLSEETDDQVRRRLLVRSPGNGTLVGRQPERSALSPRSTCIVEYADGGDGVRSAAKTATNGGTRSIPRVRTESAKLGPLGLTISEQIDAIEADAGGLSPAELRVCFDCLDSIVSEHDEETVFRFLHLLTGRIRAVNGMGHFHFTADREDRIVNVLESLFDVVVALRVIEGTVQQRWHLIDRDVSSDWLAVG